MRAKEEDDEKYVEMKAKIARTRQEEPIEMVNKWHIKRKLRMLEFSKEHILSAANLRSRIKYWMEAEKRCARKIDNLCFISWRSV